MFDVKIFANRMRSVREERGITRKAVAELLGVTKTQISDMENGKTGTTLTRLVELADFYHVSTDYLLGRTDDAVWRGEEEGQ